MSYRNNGGPRDREREDKITCTFYNKIGACRHGEKCSRKHIKPTVSETILLPNLYQNPKLNKNEGEELNPRQLEEYFEHFYKDIFIKFASIGEIRDLVVCENDNNHLNGNVYVIYREQESAYNAVLLLNQEWFGGRPVHCELSPVDNFPDANCRAYDTNSCTRGDHCNFMHVKRPRPDLKKMLTRSHDKTVYLQKLQVLTDNPNYGDDLRIGGKQVGEFKLTQPSNDSSTGEHSNVTSKDTDDSEPVEEAVSSTAAVERLFAQKS